MVNSLKNIEALSILVEELGEVGQAAGKILRFGIDNFNPVNGESSIRNLEKEIGDLLVAIELLQEYKLIDMDFISNQHIPLKRVKLRKWMNYYNTNKE